MGLRKESRKRVRSGLPIGTNGSGGFTQSPPEEAGGLSDVHQSFEEDFEAVYKLGLIGPVDTPAAIGDIDERSPEESAMPDITREEIRYQIEAVEARTDTKIARIDGKLDLLLSKMNDQATSLSSARNLIIATVVGVALTMFFGLFTVLQWSDARVFGVQSRTGDPLQQTAPPAAKPPG